MSSPTADDKRVRDVDNSLRQWRQGDVALGSKWVTCISGNPSGGPGDDGPEAGPLVDTYQVEGVVVLTQTCDIRRSAEKRPYVHVAPLRKVDDAVSKEVAKGYRIQYVRIASQPKLVADLDLITTVQKSVLAEWERTAGWSTDDDIRWFQAALARKDARFAFPDDFTLHVVKELQDRVLDKHGKNNEEGRALDSLEEIRVSAAPDWDAPDVDVFFFFVRPATAEAEALPWATYQEKWRALCKPHGTIKNVECRVTTLEGMSGKEYVESDRLDFDHLSPP